MKLATETQPDPPASDQQLLQIPFGLIGLPKLTSFSLGPVPNSWPFLSMKWLGEERMNFVVIDSIGLIPDYEVELGDEDAEALQLDSAKDALVLNIVTVHSTRPHYVTVNLVGPVIVNRRTSIGKQVIILNWSRFSSQHPLIDQRTHTNAA
jgi:flagellar assembly factor FliW